MIKALVSDFSWVLLLAVDKNYTGSLNALHRELSVKGDYDFWQYFRLNKDLLAFYKMLQPRLKLYIFTTEYIQEHSALQPHLEGVFTTVFSGGRLGIQKDTEGYAVIAQKVGVQPNEILYIDDNKSNISAAREAGMMAVYYESNDQTIKDINRLIAESL